MGSIGAVLVLVGDGHHAGIASFISISIFATESIEVKARKGFVERDKNEQSVRAYERGKGGGERKRKEQSNVRRRNVEPRQHGKPRGTCSVICALCVRAFHVSPMLQKALDSLLPLRSPASRSPQPVRHEKTVMTEYFPPFNHSNSVRRHSFALGESATRLAGAAPPSALHCCSFSFRKAERSPRTAGASLLHTPYSSQD